MLQSMGLQRVGHDWATEQEQPEISTINFWANVHADYVLCICVVF